MSDQINDCSFYFYFICANWNIVVKIVDIVIMAQDLIALCNFFIQLIYRDNMYIIPFLIASKTDSIKLNNCGISSSSSAHLTMIRFISGDI